ncbi:hypothetical protein OPIT5_00805 [Opitutaceae bacterium TAV5]|nr:hypothetical protein OPIT5_00805 [Opitutaceae bacterium TAV5]
MNRTFKASLVCIGIFVAGAVAGGMITFRYARVQPPKRPGAEDFVRMQRRQFDKLELTEDQQARIRPILEKRGEELRKLRRDSFRETTAVFEKMEAEVSRELTPEQREKLTALQQAQRERMQKWAAERASERKRRGERPEIDPVPPPPPPPGVPGAEAEPPPPPPAETRSGERP